MLYQYYHFNLVELKCWFVLYCSRPISQGLTFVDVDYKLQSEDRIELKNL